MYITCINICIAKYPIDPLIVQKFESFCPLAKSMHTMLLITLEFDSEHRNETTQSLPNALSFIY